MSAAAAVQPTMTTTMSAAVAADSRRWLSAVNEALGQAEGEQEQARCRPWPRLANDEAFDWWRIEYGGAAERIVTVGVATVETGELGRLAEALLANRGSQPEPPEGEELFRRIAEHFGRQIAGDGWAPAEVRSLERIQAPRRRDGFFAIEIGPESSSPAMLVAFDEAVEEQPADEARVRRPPESLGGVERLMDVELPVGVRFGKARMPLEKVLELKAGSLLELDRANDEPVDLTVNGAVVARGELMAVDGRYAVKITEIVNRWSRLSDV